MAAVPLDLEKRLSATLIKFVTKHPENNTYKVTVMLKKHSGKTFPYREREDFIRRAEVDAWFTELVEEWKQSRTLRNQSRRVRKSENKRVRNGAIKACYNCTLQELAKTVKALEESAAPTRKSAQDFLERRWLRSRVNDVWESMVFEYVVKVGKSERDSIALANELVGKDWAEQYAKALSGELDAAMAVIQERSADRAQAFIDTAPRQVDHCASASAERLLATILKIPGFKKLTLCSELLMPISDSGTVEFDVSEAGVVGYAPSHKNELLAFFDEALQAKGSLIIRQRIPDSAEMATAANGQQMMLAWSALYSAFFNKGQWFPVPAENLEDACCNDDQGNKVNHEERVVYKELSDFCETVQRHDI